MLPFDRLCRVLRLPMVLRIRLLPFDPGLADPLAPEPEVPIPPSVPDSVRAEIRRMYSYLVVLFP